MRIFNFIIAALVAATCSLSAYGQQKNTTTAKEGTTIDAPPPGPDAWMASLNLTADQKKKMKEIHLNTMKEIKLLKAQVGEKQAHLKTLTVADKPDMNEINKTIDEVSALKAQIMKKEMAAKMEVRSLLNDEQRMMFDQYDEMHGKGPRGKQGHKGKGKTGPCDKK